MVASGMGLSLWDHWNWYCEKGPKGEAAKRTCIPSPTIWSFGWLSRTILGVVAGEVETRIRLASAPTCHQEPGLHMAHPRARDPPLSLEKPGPKEGEETGRRECWPRLEGASRFRSVPRHFVHDREGNRYGEGVEEEASCGRRFLTNRLAEGVGAGSVGGR